MRLQRDMSGEALAAVLRRRYGNGIVRQRGSHMTLALTVDGGTHSLTVPRHRALGVGTLSGIVAAVAAHLGLTQDEMRSALFRN